MQRLWWQWNKWCGSYFVGLRMNIPKIDLKTIFTTSEVVAERRAICNACDKKVFGVCTECKCPLLSKIKVSITSCPLDKWKATIGVDVPFDGVIPDKPMPDL